MARRLQPARTSSSAAGNTGGLGEDSLTSWIEVDLDALEQNLNQIRRHCGVPILPVLKADAYGHGAPVVAAFLCSLGYSPVAVSTVEEAIAILSIVPAELVTLTPPLPAQLSLVFQYRLIPTVTSVELVRELGELAGQRRQTVGVQLKVDTGLGRLGVPPGEALALAQRIKKTPFLRLGGVFTHFSSAFHDQALTRRQLGMLLELKKVFTSRGLADLTWHAAASAASIDLPASRLDLIRPGTLIYGQSPFTLDPTWSLARSWRCKARLLQVRTLSKGQRVGYGGSYRVKATLKVGVVAVGYHHGFQLEPAKAAWRQVADALRKLHKGEPQAYWGRQPLPVIGRVGMGLTCLDLSAAPELQTGDQIELAMRRISASSSLPRIYLRGGKPTLILWNQRLWTTTGFVLSSKDPFPTEFPADPSFPPGLRNLPRR